MSFMSIVDNACALLILKNFFTIKIVRNCQFYIEKNYFNIVFKHYHRSDKLNEKHSFYKITVIYNKKKILFTLRCTNAGTELLQ